MQGQECRRDVYQNAGMQGQTGRSPVFFLRFSGKKNRGTSRLSPGSPAPGSLGTGYLGGWPAFRRRKLENGCPALRALCEGWARCRLQCRFYLCENLIIQTASYPPLPKTQERGTHCDWALAVQRLGHPPIRRTGQPPHAASYKPLRQIIRTGHAAELVCWPTKNRSIDGFDLWRIVQHDRDWINYRRFPVSRLIPTTNGYVRLRNAELCPDFIPAFPLFRF
jgi:hypothetical protein